MNDDIRDELIAITQHLIDAISAGDWQTYVDLCDPAMSCFEPEACGHLVEGMEFHRYYFELDKEETPTRATIATPHVRRLGDDVAVVCYVRLIQYIDELDQAETLAFNETRVWQRQGGHWRCVHFHRSSGN